MMFVLSCQATGTPTPSIIWYKDGAELPRNSSRIAMFQSGYLLLSEAGDDDSGLYLCIASNHVGKDIAKATVIVTDHKSGCKDRATDGLHQHEYIQACKGHWQGHVKRGRRLCAKGWKVCSSRDVSMLKLITWDEVMQLDGSHSTWKWPRCSPKCDNGGTCIAYNRCKCVQGYKGAWCQNAICPGGCIPHATCIKPGVCRCNNGYAGERCNKARDACLFPCRNGGRCKGGKCKCPLNYSGPYCQY
ncbi:hypothetical protein LSH36_1386g00004, partial [Paralvinella palmiformis]